MCRRMESAETPNEDDETTNRNRQLALAYSDRHEPIAV